jgi:signal transduction histidine kinase
MRRTVSIRTKLVALLALPLAALVAVAALGVHWSVAAAHRSRDAADRTRVALDSTGAALDVSRERGLAVSLLGDRSAGTADDAGTAAELRFQRGQTDVALDRLDRVRAGTRAASGPVDDIRVLLADLRARSDTGEITAEAARGAYTAMVEQLLQPVAGGLATIDDPGLSSVARAYTWLTRVTEAVALQQTLLMTAYSQGGLDPPAYEQLVAAVTAERLWRQQFEQVATPAQVAAVAATLRSPSVATADRLRDQAVTAGPGLLAADEGDLWFSATTRKVDLLDGVGDEVAGELADRADDRRAAADRRRNLLLGLGALAVALMAGVLILLHRLVIAPIRRLTGTAHEMADVVLPRAVALAHEGGTEAADQLTVPVVAVAADEVGKLTEAFDALQRTAVALATEQAALRRNVNDVFVNMGRRTQNLITRQIEHIDHLEAATDDPDRLADLFLLDHLATRLRRNAENMLVMAGAESPRPWVRPVSMVNVVRAALAESTDYSRVDLERLAPVAVVGAAVSDVSHLLAELIDNALAFSPPTERVVVTGRWTADARYGVAVTDAGLGMPPDRLAAANARINDPPGNDFAVSQFLGLHVVGRLADRHGIGVSLVDSPVTGVTAHVLLPASLVVTTAPAPRGVAATDGSPRHGSSVPAVPPPSPAYGGQPRLAAGATDG